MTVLLNVAGEPCPYCGGEVYEVAGVGAECGNMQCSRPSPWAGKPRQTTADLLEKAQRQEAAKLTLLIAVAKSVSSMLEDKGDEWNNEPYQEADRIDSLIRELEEASK